MTAVRFFIVLLVAASLASDALATKGGGRLRKKDKKASTDLRDCKPLRKLPQIPGQDDDVEDEVEDGRPRRPPPQRMLYLKAAEGDESCEDVIDDDGAFGYPENELCEEAGAGATVRFCRPLFRKIAKIIRKKKADGKEPVTDEDDFTVENFGRELKDFVGQCLVCPPAAEQEQEQEEEEEEEE